MRTKFFCGAITGSLLMLAATIVPLGAQAPQILIKAKRVYTAATPGLIENGQVLIEGGKIKAVGTNLAADPGAAVYTAETVVPGLVDSHTHMAQRHTRSGGPVPTTAEHRTIDDFVFDDPSLRKVLEGGVTTIVSRGSGGGQVYLSQTVAVKLKKASPKEMVLKEYADLKMYVRTGVGPSFLTLMGWRAIARAEMIKGQQYMQRWAEFEKGSAKDRPARDPRMEAYAKVLRREVPIHVHTNYAAEILMAIDFAREFNLRLTLAHANYGYQVARELKENGVIPVVGPNFIQRSYDEDRAHNVPAELMTAGVDVALETDMSGTQDKCFLEYGSLLIRYGMREEDAIKGLTINVAKAILADDRIGSLEPGKDADVALLDGPPFDLTTYVTHVFIDGKLEFELKQKPQPAKLTAVGPFKPFVSKATPAAEKIAIVNGTLFPVNSPPVSGGTVLVDRGKIVAVGAGLQVPAGYQVIDAGGRVVMPGMVAARAYPVFQWTPWWGNTRGTELMDEKTHPITPDMDSRYNLDPAMPNWKLLREVGLTTYLITPGNVNVIGGKGVVVRGIGDSFGAMVRDPEPKAMVFAIGDAARAEWGDKNFAGGGIVTMLRETLDRAKAYKTATGRGENVPRDTGLEALIPVLDKKMTALFACDKADDIRAAIKIGDDYGLRVAISGGIEAGQVISELKSRGIPVILGLSGDGWTSFEGFRGIDEQLPAKLSAAGIKVALFGPGGHRGTLPIGRLAGEPALNAAWCFKNGMSESDALKMITINGAEVAGVGDRLGTLEAGKIADVVVMNGHPLSYTSLPEMVLIDGRIVYQREAKPGSVPAARK
jgi:imidazolonepropionase-like amidohydrolase